MSHMELELEVDFETKILSGQVILSVERLNGEASVLVSSQSHSFLPFNQDYKPINCLSCHLLFVRFLTAETSKYQKLMIWIQSKN